MTNKERLYLCRARLRRAQELMQEVRAEVDLIEHNLSILEKLDETIEHYKTKGGANHGK